MKAIGGYFELEEASLISGSNIHNDALFLNYGRSCLNFIIKEKVPRKVFVPYYICDSVLVPLRQNRIPFVFYNIDETLRPALLPKLGDDEYFIYVNYFGITTGVVKELSDTYKERLIVDNTQAFFCEDTGVISFNSARKFFGVPDGAFMYGFSKDMMPVKRNTTFSTKHLELRKQGHISEGYVLFQQYENQLGTDIEKGSGFTEDILSKTDYAAIMAQRQNNFRSYHEALGLLNSFPVMSQKNDVPFVYPFWPTKEIDRKELAKKNIFIPFYWPEVMQREDTGYVYEKSLTSKMLPLPVDHRYGADEIRFVIKELLNLLQ